MNNSVRFYAYQITSKGTHCINETVLTTFTNTQIDPCGRMKNWKARTNQGLILHQPGVYFYSNVSKLLHL